MNISQSNIPNAFTEKQHKDVKLNKGEKWMNHVKYSGHTLQKKELIFCNVFTQPTVEMKS